MSAVITVRGVEFGYGQDGGSAGAASELVLKGIDLEVSRGSMVCLVGPSGSGKTTLLNVMGLLEKPLKGQVIFDGHDVGRLTERELEVLRLKRLGFVFQSFFLLPTLSVMENTSYFLPSIGLSRAEAKDRAEEVLSQVGLLDFRAKLPRELSGGQRQRVAIARALAKKPAVILADEPTANLDRKTSDTIVSVFQELREKQNVSFVFSTHDTHLVSFAQVVHPLENGKLSTPVVQSNGNGKGGGAQ
jgi:ABC-type lipoprotein export system ATPase subunit